MPRKRSRFSAPATEDTVSPEDNDISRRIFQDLSNLRNDASFSDIIVVAGGTAFRCHRAILAAVSEFFSAAFKSGMQETWERTITLHDVDADVFSTLLASIYNAKNVLTGDNLFQVWAAADMLQIKFLLPLCEELFETKLSSATCIDFCIKTRPFNGKAKQQALDLICSNFSDDLVQTKIHLLEKDEIMFVVGQDSLDLSSEDEVIESVLRWADHKLHETVEGRSSSDSCKDVKTKAEENSTLYLLSQHLADVLECTRYLLVSGHCLHETLARHPLVKDHPSCKDLVEKIARYQAQPHLHQAWCPPAAVQREQQASTRTVLVECQMVAGGKFPMLDLKEEIMRWTTTTYWSLYPTAQNGGILFHTYKGYMLTENQVISCLPKITKCEADEISLEKRFTHVIGNSLFQYFALDGVIEIKKLSNLSHISELRNFQKDHWISVYDQTLKGMCIKGVNSIRDTHILFLSNEMIDKYTIVCIDKLSRSHKTHSTQLFPHSRVVTVRHDDQVLVLQENGWLWRIRLGDGNPLAIQLTAECGLWYGNVPLNGAVLYNDQLIVVGHFQNQTRICETVNISVEGAFQSVKKIKRYGSNEKRCSKISLASVSV